MRATMEARVDGSGSEGILGGVGRSDSRLTQVLAALLLVAMLSCLVLWGVSGLKAVPDVVGLSEADARKAIEKSGFAVGAVSQVPGAAGSAGKVLEQSPRAGDRVSAGSSVNLVFAEGGSIAGGGTGTGGSTSKAAGIGALPEPPPNPPREETIVPYDSASMPSGTRVPDVMGISESVRYGASTTNVAPGIVYAQNPSAGSYASAGATVIIWLSTGAPEGGFPYPRAPYN
jgi:hypothetical protein